MPILRDNHASMAGIRAIKASRASDFMETSIITANSLPRTAILLSSILPPSSDTSPDMSSTMPTLSAPMAENTAYVLPMPALCHVLRVETIARRRGKILPP